MSGEEDRMKYLALKRNDGSVNTVRYECETASESPLTLQEEIIKELYHANRELIEELKRIHTVEKIDLNVDLDHLTK